MSAAALLTKSGKRRKHHLVGSEYLESNTHTGFYMYPPPRTWCLFVAVLFFGCGKAAMDCTDTSRDVTAICTSRRPFLSHGNCKKYRLTADYFTAQREILFSMKRKQLTLLWPWISKDTKIKIIKGVCVCVCGAGGTLLRVQGSVWSICHSWSSWEKTVCVCANLWFPRAYSPFFLFLEGRPALHSRL